MTHRILKSISVLFHPLIMPVVGVLFYFILSPRYVDYRVIGAKLISVSILTIILPLLLYFLLKTIGKVNSIYLATTKERIIPLMLNTLVVLLVIQSVFHPRPYIELYYFFIGVLTSTLSCLILALFNFKASIHMVALSGVFMFLIALSVHFGININTILACYTIIIGATATSRLHLKAHTPIELSIGLFIGVFPQLILVPNWL